MITSNIYQRVFRVCFEQDSGTGFTIDVDNRQYMITAKHLIKNHKNLSTIGVDWKGVFHQLPCKMVGTDRDVAVISLERQLSPLHPAPPSSANIPYSYDVYFLGYPYNMRINVGEMNNHFPIALVKKAIVSGIEDKIMYLDGYNNPGFSGGPIIFKLPTHDVWHICGMISGFRPEDVKLLKGEDEEETDLIVRLNSGIIIGYVIEVALDIIAKNPIGFLLSPPPSQ